MAETKIYSIPQRVTVEDCNLVTHHWYVF